MYHVCISDVSWNKSPVFFLAGPSAPRPPPPPRGLRGTRYATEYNSNNDLHYTVQSSINKKIVIHYAFFRHLANKKLLSKNISRVRSPLFSYTMVSTVAEFISTETNFHCVAYRRNGYRVSVIIAPLSRSENQYKTGDGRWGILGGCISMPVWEHFSR